MMNSTRYFALVGGLNSVGKKVFEATPIETPWNLNQIHEELTRSGSNVEYRLTQGALRHLCEAGLVYENKRGYFVRAPYRGKTAKKEEPPVATQITTPVSPSAPVPATTEQGPIERLTALSAKLRLLAKDVDDAALDLAEDFAEIEKQGEKFKQLQALLKGMT